MLQILRRLSQIGKLQAAAYLLILYIPEYVPAYRFRRVRNGNQPIKSHLFPVKTGLFPIKSRLSPKKGNVCVISRSGDTLRRRIPQIYAGRILQAILTYCTRPAKVILRPWKAFPGSRRLPETILTVLIGSNNLHFFYLLPTARYNIL